jgi:hypothetical protein
MGWHCADTCYLEAEAIMDRQTNSQSGHTTWDQHPLFARSKITSSFDNGVLIENGELIFGIVEKKTVGASQVV